MHDKANNPPSAGALLAASRASGPATVYDLDADGIIVSVRTRLARPPWKAGRLTDDQRLALLTQNGDWPEDIPAEAGIGIQNADNRYETRGDIRDQISMAMEMRRSGIMSGFWAGAEGDPNDEHG